MTHPIPGADSERAITHREYMDKCKSLRHDPTVLAWIANHQKRVLPGVAIDCGRCGFPHAAALLCGSGSYFGQFVMGAETYYVDTSNLLFLHGLVGKLAPAGAFHWREGKFFTRTEKGVEISFYEKYNNTPQKKVWVIPAMEWDSIVEQISARAAAKVGANVAADIPTWQERMPEPKQQKYCTMNCSGGVRPCEDCGTETVGGDPVVARDAEIADLRAFIAAGAPAETPKQDIDSLIGQLMGLPFTRDGEGHAILRRADVERVAMHFAAQPTPAPIAGDVEKDAARLDWLDENKAGLQWNYVRKRYDISLGWVVQAKGKTAREAIDAAMLANSSSGEAG